MDNPKALPDWVSKKYTLPKIKRVKRANGLLSRPDAELIGNKNRIHIVLDAKYYSTELGEDTILKTYDDMCLRNATGALLICSDKAIIPGTLPKDVKNLHFVKLNFV